MNARFLDVFDKVRKKGPKFTIIFYTFFFLCIIPLMVLFFIALLKSLVVAVTIFLVLIGVILFEIKLKHLYQLVLLIIVLNLFLWFMLGLLGFVSDVLSWLPGIFSYILLAPYALLSSYFAYYLLWTSSRNVKLTVRGGIIISMMIAIVSAVTDIIIDIGSNIESQVHTAESILSVNADMLLSFFADTFYNPIIGFLVIVLFFNIPFVYKGWKSKYRRELWGYVLPFIVFFVLRLLG